jgi:hypothetical protein
MPAKAALHSPLRRNRGSAADRRSVGRGDWMLRSIESTALPKRTSSVDIVAGYRSIPPRRQPIRPQERVGAIGDYSNGVAGGGPECE